MGFRIRHLFLISVLLILCVQDGGWPAPNEQKYPEFIEQVFLTEDGALKSVFPDSDRIVREIHILTPSQKKKIEMRLGWTLSETTVTVHAGFKNDQIQGRAMIMEEIGKFKPITFIVKVSNEGKIERVEVLTYREPVGSEVRKQRFARQFKGKTAKDPLRINRDILNITGATMSVQAVTAGVKKTLVILDELHGNK